ncbi:MAG TPA: phosphatase PAP2 family protein, partial [Gemmatimonadaceae bacterium]|nr:phosphatase PAP2 family protein [Gemmatimonadaceae bacterium]
VFAQGQAPPGDSTALRGDSAAAADSARALLTARAAARATAMPGAADTLIRRPTNVRGAAQQVDLGVHGVYEYRRPVRLRMLREIPSTVGGTFTLGLRPASLAEWGAVAVSTAALYAADDYLVDKTRMLARHVGLPPNHPSINLRFAGMKLPIPSTVGSALYFLGDGMTDVLIAGGFLVHGMRKDDHRARTTASEITSGLVSLGVYTQLLKRSFGRQTPNAATEPRGRWRPFPDLGDYNANVPAYDAMPSGHMAAAMSTVEIIALNYPEKTFVRPLGYSLMTVLGFAMVNNGVHWTSDYPLALLIGGGVARVTVARGRAQLQAAGGGAAASSEPARGARGFTWSPLVTPRAVGLTVGLPY